MSGSLLRALGCKVVELSPGLHVFRSPLANRRRRYPACYLDVVENLFYPGGCGKRQVQEHDPDTGWAVKSGNIFRHEMSVRLTLASPDTPDAPGQDIADALADRLNRDIAALPLQGAELTLVDSGVDPAESFPLDWLKAADRAEIPADTSGEPFIHRAALTIKLARFTPRLVTVESNIEFDLDYAIF